MTSSDDKRLGAGGDLGGAAAMEHHVFQFADFINGNGTYGKYGRDFSYTVSQMALVNPVAAGSIIGTIAMVGAIHSIATSSIVRYKRYRNQLNKLYREVDSDKGLNGRRGWFERKNENDFGTGPKPFEKELNRQLKEGLDGLKAVVGRDGHAKYQTASEYMDKRSKINTLGSVLAHSMQYLYLPKTIISSYETAYQELLKGSPKSSNSSNGVIYQPPTLEQIQKVLQSKADNTAYYPIMHQLQEQVETIKKAGKDICDGYRARQGYAIKRGNQRAIKYGNFLDEHWHKMYLKIEEKYRHVVNEFVSNSGYSNFCRGVDTIEDVKDSVTALSKALTDAAVGDMWVKQTQDGPEYYIVHKKYGLGGSKVDLEYINSGLASGVSNVVPDVDYLKDLCEDDKFTKYKESGRKILSSSTQSPNGGGVICKVHTNFTDQLMPLLHGSGTTCKIDEMYVKAWIVKYDGSAPVLAFSGTSTPSSGTNVVCFEILNYAAFVPKYFYAPYDAFTQAIITSGYLGENTIGGDTTTKTSAPDRRAKESANDVYDSTKRLFEDDEPKNDLNVSFDDGDSNKEKSDFEVVGSQEKSEDDKKEPTTSLSEHKSAISGGAWLPFGFYYWPGDKKVVFAGNNNGKIAYVEYSNLENGEGDAGETGESGEISANNWISKKPTYLMLFDNQKKKDNQTSKPTPTRDDNVDDNDDDKKDDNGGDAIVNNNTLINAIFVNFDSYDSENEVEDVEYIEATDDNNAIGGQNTKAIGPHSNKALGSGSGGVIEGIDCSDNSDPQDYIALGKTQYPLTYKSYLDKYIKMINPREGSVVYNVCSFDRMSKDNGYYKYSIDKDKDSKDPISMALYKSEIKFNSESNLSIPMAYLITVATQALADTNKVLFESEDDYKKILGSNAEKYIKTYKTAANESKKEGGSNSINESSYNASVRLFEEEGVDDPNQSTKNDVKRTEEIVTYVGGLRKKFEELKEKVTEFPEELKMPLAVFKYCIDRNLHETLKEVTDFFIKKMEKDRYYSVKNAAFEEMVNEVSDTKPTEVPDGNDPNLAAFNPDAGEKSVFYVKDKSDDIVTIVYKDEDGKVYERQISIEHMKKTAVNMSILTTFSEKNERIEACLSNKLKIRVGYTYRIDRKIIDKLEKVDENLARIYRYYKALNEGRVYEAANSGDRLFMVCEDITTERDGVIKMKLIIDGKEEERSYKINDIIALYNENGKKPLWTRYSMPTRLKEGTSYKLNTKSGKDFDSIFGEGFDANGVIKVEKNDADGSLITFSTGKGSTEPVPYYKIDVKDFVPYQEEEKKEEREFPRIGRIYEMTKSDFVNSDVYTKMEEDANRKVLDKKLESLKEDSDKLKFRVEDKKKDENDENKTLVEILYMFPDEKENELKQLVPLEFFESIEDGKYEDVTDKQTEENAVQKFVGGATISAEQQAKFKEFLKIDSSNMDLIIKYFKTNQNDYTDVASLLFGRSDYEMNDSNAKSLVETLIGVTHNLSTNEGTLKENERYNLIYNNEGGIPKNVVCVYNGQEMIRLYFRHKTDKSLQ